MKTTARDSKQGDSDVDNRVTLVSRSVESKASTSDPDHTGGTTTMIMREDNVENMVEQQAHDAGDSKKSSSISVDVVVHRIRHLSYKPKPILCIQSTPKTARYSHVAISRENGSVELKHVGEKFRTIGTVPGLRNAPVNAIAYVCGSGCKVHGETFIEPVLVGASRNGCVFIVEFASRELVGVVPSGGGSVFALVSLCQKAAQVCLDDSYACVVAAGCEDGSIRIFRVVAQNQLESISVVPSLGAPVLSLAWIRNKCIPPSPSDDSATILFAGCADGTIRRYTSDHSLKWKSTWRITLESLGRTTPTRVWALQAFSDGTLVSGDSLGHVQIWDGQIGTLHCSFDQNDSKADVLDLDVTDDECKVFASGIDSRVVCIERSKTWSNSSLAGQVPKWILSHAQRPHTHDVKAVCVCSVKKRNGGVREILCTGGIDTKLCTYHVRDFHKKRPRALLPWPGQSPVSVAREARILSIMREDRVDIYRLANKVETDIQVNAPFLVDETDTLLGTVEIQDSSNLVCSTVSANGRLLAIATVASLLLFRLEYLDGPDSHSVVPTRIALPPISELPVCAMHFKSDEQLLISCKKGSVQLIEVAVERDADVSLMVTTIRGSNDGDIGRKSVESIVASQDGSWVALYSLDFVDIYHHGQEGSFKHWWTIPQLDVSRSAVAFLPDSSGRLIVTCIDFSMYIFDVRERRLNQWSEDAGFPASTAMPPELHRGDYPIRIGTNPADPSYLFLGSFGAMIAIDTKRKFPNSCTIFPETHVRGKKRQRTLSVASVTDNASTIHGNSDESSCTLCLRYNSMLYMDFISENEMLIVEQPWFAIRASLPEALERRVYGT